MTRQRRIDTIIYQIADFLTAMLSWACFFLYRKQLEGAPLNLEVLDDVNFWYGIVIIPIGWLLFYGIFDRYIDIYRLSRLATLARTFFLSFFGVTFLFFTLMLDDFVTNYTTYYSSFITLFFLHFFFTATVRMVLLTRASRRLKSGKVTYNTIIIGGNQNAVELYEEIAGREKGLGNKFIGFIDANGKSKNELKEDLPTWVKSSSWSRLFSTTKSRKSLSPLKHRNTTAFGKSSIFCSTSGIRFWSKLFPICTTLCLVPSR